jgi:hypothetical protein
MTAMNEQVGRRADIAARTLRRDRWWVQPAVTFIVLFAFVVYGLYITFANHDYFWEPYLSPFFSHA